MVILVILLQFKNPASTTSREQHIFYFITFSVQLQTKYIYSWLLSIYVALSSHSSFLFCLYISKNSECHSHLVKETSVETLIHCSSTCRSPVRFQTMQEDLGFNFLHYFSCAPLCIMLSQQQKLLLSLKK